MFDAAAFSPASTSAGLHRSSHRRPPPHPSCCRRLLVPIATSRRCRLLVATAGSRRLLVAAAGSRRHLHLVAATCKPPSPPHRSRPSLPPPSPNLLRHPLRASSGTPKDASAVAVTIAASSTRPPFPTENPPSASLSLNPFIACSYFWFCGQLGSIGGCINVLYTLLGLSFIHST